MTSLFETVGGEAFFERLVDRFYEGVSGDDVLLRLYPEPNDLAGARKRLTLFLMQYWGGPTTYSDERGHPRLRQRHFPFAIGERERDHWLIHMCKAIDEVSPNEDIRTQLTEYVTNAATHLVNQPPSA
ncbi:MAG: globin [Ilumatobacteraceae bacterium]